MAIQPIRIVIQGIDKFSNTLSQSHAKIEKLGKSIGRVGRKMTMGLTLPIVAMGGAALKTTADFEQSMLRVGNLTGATGESFQALEKQARNLGATTLHTASAAAEGMGFLGMAGFKTDQILSAMPATLDLATAGMVDLGRSADIMSNVLTGYNLKASESTRVVDVMVDTMNSANTNMEQLAEAMKFVAPIAAGMKQPIETTATAIGMLSNAGIQGAMAGTQLRGILATLAKPTSEAREALARLKIPKSAIIDSAGNVKDLGQVIEAFEKSGAKTSDFLAIFNKRIGPGMAALVSQGSAAFKELNKDIVDSGGEARKSAAVFEKSLIGQLKALRSALEELAIAMFKDTGLLEDLVGITKKAIVFVRGLTKTNPQLLKMAFLFAGIVAAIGPLLMIIGPLLIGIAKLSAAITSAGGIIALLSNPIGWIITAILALIGVFTVMKMKFGMSIKSMLAGFLLFSGPIGLFAGVLIKKWDRLIPYLKLIGMLFIGLAKLIPYLFWPVFKLFEMLGKVIGWVADKIFNILDAITRLVLPKWLEKKIGLTTEGGGAGALAMAERTGSVLNQNENTTNIKIENRANASVRTETEKGNVNMEIDRGLLFQGAF